MSYRSPRATQATLRALVAFAMAVVAGCGDAEIDHPWIDLGPDSPHRIIESLGSDDGQVVIVMPATVSMEEALELGRLIQSQAPSGASVNVRLYNDEATARNWRTVEAEWTLQHLLVVVQIVPETGRNDVRWVGPDPGA